MEHPRTLDINNLLHILDYNNIAHLVHSFKHWVPVNVGVVVALTWLTARHLIGRRQA